MGGGISQEECDKQKTTLKTEAAKKHKTTMDKLNKNITDAMEEMGCSSTDPADLATCLADYMKRKEESTKEKEETPEEVEAQQASPDDDPTDPPGPPPESAAMVRLGIWKPNW